MRHANPAARRFRTLAIGLAAAALAIGGASAIAGPPWNGWRGNGTGLWPAARVATEWSVAPRGAVEGLRCSAQPLPDDAAAPVDAPLVQNGLLRDWLVLGPLTVDDSVRDFDREALTNLDRLRPAAGERPAGLSDVSATSNAANNTERKWQPLQVPADDPMTFGTAELAWLDLARLFPFRPNQFAYVHTYVYSPRGGPVRWVADHAHGLKAWLNGRELFRSPTRHTGLGFYTAISRHELGHLEQRTSTFGGELQPGWNRLLLKVSSSNDCGTKPTARRGCNCAVRSPRHWRTSTRCDSSRRWTDG